jgi:hypothetical protein
MVIVFYGLLVESKMLIRYRFVDKPAGKLERQPSAITTHTSLLIEYTHMRVSKKVKYSNHGTDPENEVFRTICRGTKEFKTISDFFKFQSKMKCEQLDMANVFPIGHVCNNDAFYQMSMLTGNPKPDRCTDGHIMTINCIDSDCAHCTAIVIPGTRLMGDFREGVRIIANKLDNPVSRTIIQKVANFIPNKFFHWYRKVTGLR